MPGSSPGMTISRGSPHEILFLLAIADRKSTRLNSSHLVISYAVFCLKKKKVNPVTDRRACHDSIDTAARHPRVRCPRAGAPTSVVPRLGADVFRSYGSLPIACTAAWR